jgi:hypothetical protein
MIHFDMVFVVLMTGTTLLDVVSASEVAKARWTRLPSITDGIKGLQAGARPEELSR